MSLCAVGVLLLPISAATELSMTTAVWLLRRRTGGCPAAFPLAFLFRGIMVCIERKYKKLGAVYRVLIVTV